MKAPFMLKPIILTVFSLLLFSLPCHSMQRYAVARIPTPVLNTSAFTSVFGGKDGHTLKTDRCGMPRELEFIALPGTVFSIISETHSSATTLYEVTTSEYPKPSGTKLYLDARFIEIREHKPFERKKSLPERQQILANLQESIGEPYLWGGNVSAGIPELDIWYYKNAPYSTVIDTGKPPRTLAGIDCSGLLYQATGGWTPRNTSQLIYFGDGLKIKGKSAEEIYMALEPLDLIVWDGHVVIVFDQETAIESRLECGKNGVRGVVTTPLKQRLLEIMKKRKPANQWQEKMAPHSSFVIRRWYKDRQQQ